MRYSLLMHYVEADTAPEGGQLQLSEEELKAGMAAFDAYAADLDKAGVLVSADVLQPVANATTVAFRNGSVQVQDGPFADTKEQLGGTFVIEVPDLDAALAWAEKCPAAQWGTVEVRPSSVIYRDGSWQNMQ